MNMREKFMGTNEGGQGGRKVGVDSGQYSLLTHIKLSNNRFN